MSEEVLLEAHEFEKETSLSTGSLFGKKRKHWEVEEGLRKGEVCSKGVGN